MPRLEWSFWIHSLCTSWLPELGYICKSHRKELTFLSYIKFKFASGRIFFAKKVRVIIVIIAVLILLGLMMMVKIITVLTPKIALLYVKKTKRAAVFFFAYFNVLTDNISYRLSSAIWSYCLLIISMTTTHEVIDTLKPFKNKCCEKVFFQKVHL